MFSLERTPSAVDGKASAALFDYNGFHITLWRIQMPEMQSYPHGTFAWVDLATTDHTAAKEFYRPLFGWDASDLPIGEGMVYTMFTLRGKNVAAVSQLSEELKTQGVPPHWSSYVSVTDVDQIADKAKELGGTVLVEPMDVFEEGRMAFIQDPTGASVGLWQPKNHIGAQIVNEPGGFCWNELATRDVDAAKKFYSNLFGWSADTQDMSMGPYTVFKNGDAFAGGMLQMTDEWGEIPPHWMVYFAVDDCDARAQQIKDLGGEIHVEPMDIPDVGRFAVASDPQGGHFTVMKLAN